MPMAQPQRVPKKRERHDLNVGHHLQQKSLKFVQEVAEQQCQVFSVNPFSPPFTKVLLVKIPFDWGAQKDDR